MKIGLVNCRVLPEPDPDESPLLRALRGAGHWAERIAWDDERADLGAFDVCFLRATWNLHLNPREFLDWVGRASARTRLWNPADVIRWNIDKRYLAELERAGVPIVETAWVERGERVDAGAIAGERGWASFVVKPVVSASSFMTRRFGGDEVGAARAFLGEASRERAMMVQRYMPSVERGGERAIVWIDGEATHAVVKSPRFESDEERVRGVALRDVDRSFARRVIEAAGKRVYYARVDVMEDADGSLRLSELELIEPSLFFEHGQRALSRFVAGVDRLGEG